MIVRLAAIASGLVACSVSAGAQQSLSVRLTAGDRNPSACTAGDAAMSRPQTVTIANDVATIKSNGGINDRANGEPRHLQDPVVRRRHRLRHRNQHQRLAGDHDRRGAQARLQVDESSDVESSAARREQGAERVGRKTRRSVTNRLDTGRFPVQKGVRHSFVGCNDARTPKGRCGFHCHRTRAGSVSPDRGRLGDRAPVPAGPPVAI